MLPNSREPTSVLCLSPLVLVPILGQVTTLLRAGKLLLELSPYSPPQLVADPTRSPVLPDAISRTAAYMQHQDPAPLNSRYNVSIYPRGASQAYIASNADVEYGVTRLKKKTLPDTTY